MNSLVTKLLNINVPILITGPSGTGKSQMAKTIFKNSHIHQDRFLTLHLASIKEELLESELFGHKKGSFTGAIDNKSGYFSDVGMGTLFLDEIGELSLESQKKLLYLLEERKFTPVGSTNALDFRGRVVMATNKDLRAMVKKGEFREDLYFRLSIFQIELSGLASDRENLLISIRTVFNEMKNKYQKHRLEFSSEVEALLLQAPWKGNYRELKNCLEYVVALTDGHLVKKENLPHWFMEELELDLASSEHDFIAQFPTDFNLALENFESWYLNSMFKKFGGRVNETARILGMSKTTLIYKAKKYRINTLQLRADASNIDGALKAA